MRNAFHFSHIVILYITVLGVPSWLNWQERLRLRVRLRRVRAPRRRRIHLRRGDRAHRVHRGQAGQAASEAALPRRRGAVRLPNDSEQR